MDICISISLHWLKDFHRKCIHNSSLLSFSASTFCRKSHCHPKAVVVRSSIWTISSFSFLWNRANRKISLSYWIFTDIPRSINTFCIDKVYLSIQVIVQERGKWTIINVVVIYGYDLHLPILLTTYYSCYQSLAQTIFIHY